MLLKKQLISCAVALSVAFSSMPLVAADETEELEQQLEDLQQQADAQQQETERIQKDIENVSEELRILDESVGVAQAEYDNVSNALDRTENKIVANQELLEETEQKLAVKQKILGRRVRDIYVHGKLSYIDVLFGAKNLTDLFTRMDLLTRVIKHDYSLVQLVLDDKRVVERARAELEEEYAERKELVRDAAAKETRLRSAKAEKDEMLDRLEQDMALSQQAYEELLAASEEVERLIQQSRYVYSGPVTGSGEMIWPIVGEITSEFGWRTHPIYGDSRYHSGLDIAGDYGDPIHAAAAGQVIYSGWISGYGYAVVIDHGGGISTLYGHNESLVVSEGQIVAQGQVIAYCGSTGNSTGPHCHFEVREGGEPVSPWGYL